MSILTPFSIGTGAEVHEISAELDLVFGVLRIGFEGIIIPIVIGIRHVEIFLMVLALFLTFRLSRLFRTALGGRAMGL